MNPLPFLLICAMVMIACQVARETTPPVPQRILYVTSGMDGDYLTRADAMVSMWHGDAHVISCEDSPDILEGAFDVAVHVGYGCPWVLTHPHIQFHVWDVVDMYRLDQWDWKWDGAIVSTTAVDDDFCSARPYPCHVIPDIVTNVCSPHAILASPVFIDIVGVTGATHATERDVMDALGWMFAVTVLEERNVDIYAYREASRVVRRANRDVSIDDILNMTATSIPCTYFWDMIDVGIVWHQSPSVTLEDELRYDSCTRLLTLAHLHIPAIVTGAYRCVDDLMGEKEKGVLAAGSYEEMEWMLEDLTDSGYRRQNLAVLERIRKNTSRAVIIDLYIDLFTSLE